MIERHGMLRRTRPFDTVYSWKVNDKFLVARENQQFNGFNGMWYHVLHCIVTFDPLERWYYSIPSGVWLHGGKRPFQIDEEILCLPRLNSRDEWLWTDYSHDPSCYIMEMFL